MCESIEPSFILGNYSFEFLVLSSDFSDVLLVDGHSLSDFGFVGCHCCFHFIELSLQSFIFGGNSSNVGRAVVDERVYFDVGFSQSFA